MSTSSAQRAPIFERIAAIVSSAPAIALAALAILLHAPISGSLWLDESVSAWIIRDGTAALFERVSEYQGQSPFYFVALWAWSGIFGSSETALRTLSMAAACGTACAAFAIARELRDRECGLWTVLFLLASDGFVKSALSARPYALALFLLTLSVYFLVYWLKSGRMLHLVAATLSTLGAFYCQYFFGQIVLVQLALVALRQDARARLGAFLVSLAVLFAASLPGIAHLLDIAARQGLYAFAGLPGGKELLLALVPPNLLVYFLTALLLARVYYRFSFSELGPRALLIAVLWWLMPVMTFFLASWALGSSLFFWRFYLWSSVGLALCLALVLRAIDVAIARRVVAAVVVALLVLVPRQWLVEDWRQAAVIVNKELSAASDQPVLVYSGFIELEDPAWLVHPERRAYLLAPFERYPLDTNPVLISSDLGAGAGRDHFEWNVLPLLEQAKRALLVSPHMQQLSGSGGAVPEHFEAELRRRGYEVSYLQKTGLVWVLSIQQAADASGSEDASR